MKKIGRLLAVLCAVTALLFLVTPSQAAENATQNLKGKQFKDTTDPCKNEGPSGCSGGDRPKPKPTVHGLPDCQPHWGDLCQPPGKPTGGAK